MIRSQMNMAYQSMPGFGPPMSPGMGLIQSPAMMNNSVHMTPEVGLVGFFTSWVGWRSFYCLDAELQAVDAKASSQGSGTTPDG